MSKQAWRGGALIAPVPPVMVSCGSLESPNVMTIAWTGIINTQPPMTYISVRSSRYSYDLIKESGEFVINLPVKSLVRAVDYCGCRSGRETDKLGDCGLTAAPSVHLSAPLLEECPINLECRVKSVTPLGTHHMFIADIVGVNVDESALDEKGRLMVEKLDLICYAHGTYFSLGKELGTFGHSVRKKPAKKGKRPSNRGKNTSKSKRKGDSQ